MSMLIIVLYFVMDEFQIIPYYITAITSRRGNYRIKFKRLSVESNRLLQSEKY